MQELYVSFISSLLILPLNLLVDQLFRRSRPKAHKTDTAFAEPTGGPQTTAGPSGDQQQDQDVQAIRSRIFQVTDCPDVSKCFEDTDPHKSNSQDTPTTDLGTAGEQGQDRSSSTRTTTKNNGKDSSSKKAEKAVSGKPLGSKPSPRRKGGRVMLPHWCVYVGWVLVVSMSGVSTFITFSYSMEWGREKSIAWLSAMLMSVGQSVMLVQPFKVSGVKLVCRGFVCFIA